jgi:hypothetical protein
MVTNFSRKFTEEKYLEPSYSAAEKGKLKSVLSGVIKLQYRIEI